MPADLRRPAPLALAAFFGWAAFVALGAIYAASALDRLAAAIDPPPPELLSARRGVGFLVLATLGSAALAGRWLGRRIEGPLRGAEDERDAARAERDLALARQRGLQAAVAEVAALAAQAQRSIQECSRDLEEAVEIARARSIEDAPESAACPEPLRDASRSMRELARGMSKRGEAARLAALNAQVAALKGDPAAGILLAADAREAADQLVAAAADASERADAIERAADEIRPSRERATGGHALVAQALARGAQAARSAAESVDAAARGARVLLGEG